MADAVDPTTSAILRGNAYRAISDPLGMRVYRLALANDLGAPAAQTTYLAAVAAIQAQYPDPPAS